MHKFHWFVLAFMCACTSKKTINYSANQLDSSLKRIYKNYTFKDTLWPNQMAEIKPHLVVLNDPNLLSKYYAALGLFVQNQGNLDSAVALQLKALDYSKKTGNDINNFNKYLNLAELYNTMKATDENLKILQKCRKIINKVGPEKQIYYYTQLGKYYVNLEKLELAKSAFYKAHYLSINNPKLNKTGPCLENLANIYNQQENFDSALHYYNKTEAIYVKQKDSVNLATLYHNIVECFWEYLPKKTLLNYLEKGLKICQKHSTIEIQRLYLYNLAYYYTENNNKELANKYLWDHQQLSDSIYSTDLISNVAKLEKKYAIQEKAIENEKLSIQLKQKNTLKNAALIIASLLALLGIFQYRSYLRKKRIMDQEKELANQQIDSLLKEKEIKNMNSLLEGREEERQRIGRDLHDRLGSILSTVKLHFSTMEDKIELLKTENKEQYKMATNLLDQAVTEVRKISHDLVSGTLVNVGLNEALQELTENLKISNKLKTNFYSNKKQINLPLITEIALYRIAQELISNVLKHAQATEITINLTYTPEQVTFMLEDNGRGFDTSIENKGIGLKNILSRAQELNGIITIDSQPNKGTTAIVEIPIKINKI